MDKQDELKPLSDAEEAKLGATLALLNDDPDQEIRVTARVLCRYLSRYTPPRWIPVEERLPECGTECLVLVLGIRRPVMAWMTGEGTWRDFNPLDPEIPEVSQATHWMPLPEPPEERTDG